LQDAVDEQQPDTLRSQLSTESQITASRMEIHPPPSTKRAL
jgi:hypothetical protein